MTQPESVVLPRVPSSARRARLLVLAALEAAGRHDLPQAGVVELLVSELATNAIRYGVGEHFRLQVEVTAEGVRVAVHDRNPVVPQPRLATPADEGGRGVHLVDTLATTWGAQAGPDGKTVWFTLAAHGRPAPGVTGPRGDRPQG